MEFLQYSFITNALMAGVLTALSAALLGNFMIVARQAVMSDMLAHAAVAGVGLGVFWNINPIAGAFLTSVAATLLLWWLSQKKQAAPEAISVVILNGSLALALLLIHIDSRSGFSLESYLFGSILTITQNELYLFVALNILIISLLTLFWKPLLALVFDQDFLHSNNPYKRFFEILLMLLIAAIVGIGLKVVGGLLIGAMLIIPPLIVQSYCSSFKQNVIMSALINILAVLCGIISSFYFDIPASSSIVLTLILLFGLAKIPMIRTQ